MSEPFKFTTYLGFELDRETPAVRVDIEPRHKNSRKVVHGSVILALLDTVMGLVCRKELGQKVATAEISVRFLEAASEGRLEARARIVKAGKRLIVLEGEVRLGETLVAVGQGTFVPMGEG